MLKLFLSAIVLHSFSVRGGDSPEEGLREVISCALERALSSERKAQSLKALDPLIPRLVRGFEHYGLDSHAQKAHFLGQAMHETHHFTAMARRPGESERWDRALEALTGEQRDCAPYLEALEEDRGHYLRKTTRASFRPRGMIHIHGCTNYLGFFYHKALEREGIEDVAQKRMRTSFEYQNHRGRWVLAGDFCGPHALEQISRNFHLPEALVENSGEAMDEFVPSLSGARHWGDG